MASTEDVFAALDACGIPWASGGWPEGRSPEPPYVVAMPEGVRTFWADNCPWLTQVTHDLRLYTDLRRSPATEARLERALASRGLAWRKGFQPLPSERMHETYYEVTVSGDPELEEDHGGSR